MLAAQGLRRLVRRARFNPTTFQVVSFSLQIQRRRRIDAGGAARAEAILGAAPVGAVDEKTIMEYVESQKWNQDDQGFKITAPEER